MTSAVCGGVQHDSRRGRWSRDSPGLKGRRTNLIAAGLLAVGLLGPALSTQVVGASSPVTAPANDGPELHWALANSPDTLFAPTYFNTPIGSSMMGLIQDNLLAYTGDGELVPSGHRRGRRPARPRTSTRCATTSSSPTAARSPRRTSSSRSTSRAIPPSPPRSRRCSRTSNRSRSTATTSRSS